MTKLAYVGTPCHIEGISKVAALSKDIGQDWVNKVALKIGLFCRENWCYTCFRTLIEDDYGVKLEDVAKFDIKKNHLIGYQKNGDKREFHLEKAKP